MGASIGVNLSIVQTLQQYGAIPIDYLARVLGRRRSEIEELLATLEAENVVRRDNDLIRLTTPGANPVNRAKETA